MSIFGSPRCGVPYLRVPFIQNKLYTNVVSRYETVPTRYNKIVETAEFDLSPLALVAGSRTITSDQTVFFLNSSARRWIEVTHSLLPVLPYVSIYLKLRKHCNLQSNILDVARERLTRCFCWFCICYEKYLSIWSWKKFGVNNIFARCCTINYFNAFPASWN